MSRACSVCSHPDRFDIDAALLGLHGKRLSQREVAAQWGLAKSAVQRHAGAHVAPIMRAVQDQVQSLNASTMLTELGGLYEAAQRALSAAENAGEMRDTIAAIREARAIVESFAKVGLAMAQHEARQSEAPRDDLDDRIAEALSRRMRAEPIAALGESEGVEDADIAEGEVLD